MRLPHMRRRTSWLLVHVAHSDVNKLRKARDTEGLLRLLDLSDPVEKEFPKRAVAAIALGELRARAAVPRLTALLDRTEDAQVRVAAAIGLSRIGGPEAETALLPAV